MSFENFPNAEKPDHTPAQTSSNKGRNFLTAALVIALLGTWAYIIWDKNQTKETIQQKDLVITNTSTQRDQLQKELEEATLLYDMIKSSSAKMAHSKDSTISRKDREINNKRNQIQQLLSKVGATEAELSQAKGLISSLNGDILGYKTQIETLEGEKIVLTNQRNAVIQERDQVLKEFDSATTVIRQKENALNIASTLSASNFSILGIKETSGGKEKRTTVAKRVDMLRISFDINENRVTESGIKDIYICITDPGGNPLSNAALGSGQFTTRDGEQKFYTKKVDLNYLQGKRQSVTTDWKQPTNYETGDYKIEIYNNGFKIGEGVRSLKKGGLFS